MVEFRTMNVFNFTLVLFCLDLINYANSRPFTDEPVNEDYGGHHHHHHHRLKSYHHQNITRRLVLNDSNPRILNRDTNPENSREQLNSDFVPERDHNAIVFQDSPSDFIFPNSSGDSDREPIRPPKCITDQTFCEDVDSYPAQQLTQLLSRANLNENFFGVDQVPPEITNRIGEEPDEKFFCTSIEKTIYPKAGITKSNKLKYIVNTDDKYIQGVRVELCSNADGPCKLLSDPPSGYIVKCKQKYMYRRLLALSDRGQPIPDTFKLPSACCCSYKRDPNFLINFGK